MVAFYASSVEYLDATVTAEVPLGTQVVQISIDAGATYHAATWTSGVGKTTAVASMLLGSGVAMPAVGSYGVRVKVTNTPEIPVIDAGTLSVIP